MNIGQSIRDKINVTVGVDIFQTENNNPKICVKLKNKLYLTLWNIVSNRTQNNIRNITQKYENR
jgi:hypothetical protein